jgi:FlaG/FlaF family flagellin (archaellin)
MKRKNFFRNIKAVSPVIATIILVAISIVMAISVAYWALGIGGSFTKFEKIQYTYAYPTSDGSDWSIHLNIKNTGTATATINNIFLNGQPYDTYTTALPTVTFDPDSTLVNPGQNSTVTITAAYSEQWASGMSVQVDVMTAAGNSYPTTVMIP